MRSTVVPQAEEDGRVGNRAELTLELGGRALEPPPDRWGHILVTFSQSLVFLQVTSLSTIIIALLTLLLGK